MSKTIVLTKEKAEEMGHAQVKHQSDISGAQNYKFVRVGSLDECWQGYELNKYHNLHKRLLVWRIDGAEFGEVGGDEGWIEGKVIYTNKDGQYWYVVADYAQNSPIWREYIASMSSKQREFLRESNRMHRRINKRMSP